MPRKVRNFLILLALAVIPPTIIQAAIINVPTDAGTIRDGVFLADYFDTIIVAPGIYQGLGNRNIGFYGKSLHIRSLKGPLLTIINCLGTPEFPYRGFHFGQEDDAAAILEGFTITGGYALPDGPDRQSVGGGILCNARSSPTIINCIIRGNTATDAGGGVCILDGASPHFIDCIISDNLVLNDNYKSIAGYGGGVRIYKALPVMQNCIISGNTANIGGGVSVNSSYPIFENCQIYDNTAEVTVTFEPYYPGVGGGLHLYNSLGRLTSCTLTGNRALSGVNMSGISAMGGAIAAFGGSLFVDNCTLLRNEAELYMESVPGRGAGLYVFDCPATVTNTIFAFNLHGGPIHAAGDFEQDSTLIPVFQCSDLFGNEGGDWIGIIADQAGRDGNLSVDPLFCDTVLEDFHLQLQSPCAPGNNDCGVLIGAWTAGCITDVEEPLAGGPLPFGLDQNHPNPFNLSTVIEYTLPSSRRVALTVYNALGQTVRRLKDGFQPAGRHRVVWDGRDEAGQEVASGIYLYRISAGDIEQTRKMVLLK